MHLGGAVAEPTLAREGNLRLASLASRGYPIDPFALAHEVARLLEGQEVEAYGATTVLVSLPPEDQPPAAWECQVGTAITGLARPIGPLLVEDYRQLRALSLPHAGPIKDLPATWRRLAEKARAMGGGVRPYWRIALRNRRLADGNMLPSADVSVFLDG
jgi:hypothetical protein